jgi:cobyrinic acid a,c-diamide synthase
VRRIGEIIAGQVDLDCIVAAGGGFATRHALLEATSSGLSDGVVRIGVVADRAFGFYYADDLEALRSAGAELVAIDALHDRNLPPLDGLFIGGGFSGNVRTGNSRRTRACARTFARRRWAACRSMLSAAV